ncbi:MAG: hypothetical protein FJ395_20555 [Verrucomicrobia bacterium]|nr:hypothetical protein [Verrucomicrobiota bacterium]
MKNTLRSLTLAGLLLALAAPLEARTFTYFNGHKAEAELVSLVGNQVTIRVAGRPFVLPITMFSPDDQKFIRESAGGATPTTPATAPTPATPTLRDGRIGMNFIDLAYYAANDPWKNLFKSACPWMREGQRDDKPADFDLDANGYIKRLRDGEAAFTFVGMTPTFPAGDYVLLYDGEGSFKFGNSAIAVSAKRGRIVVRVKNSSSSRPGVRITLTTTDPKGTGDYVRNIRFMEPRFESSYLKDPWHPRFIELWKNYSIVRFVCWQEINYSTVREWSDNAPRDAMSYCRDKAIPPEWIVEYLNYTGKDGWICIPHLASDDYARTLGRFLREKLRPDLKLVIEYSNEFWHPGFAVGKWAQARVARPA